VASWMCNGFSSIYFEQAATVFEHIWTDFGVTFMKRKDDGSLRYWGFTEELCGLHGLVLGEHRNEHGFVLPEWRISLL
jgi:hypothetical protein